MKKTLIRLSPVYICLALACSLTVWAVARTKQQPETKKPQPTNQKQYKSLRQEAQERDVEILASEVNTQASSVQYLKKTAMAIVIGHISEEKSYFDGDSNTELQFNVRLKYQTTVARSIVYGHGESQF